MNKHEKLGRAVYEALEMYLCESLVNLCDKTRIDLLDEVGQCSVPKDEVCLMLDVPIRKCLVDIAIKHGKRKHTVDSHRWEHAWYITVD